MTEEHWSPCTSPHAILDFLQDRYPAEERKLRLAAAGCCRRAWHLLDADGRAVVGMSERFADGSVTEAELRAAVWASRGGEPIDARSAVDYAAVGALRPALALLAALGGERASEERLQADLLRCVLGPLPFRSVHIDPRWRTPPALSLARAAYEGRVAPDPKNSGWLVLDPTRLLVMTDALEKAGCPDPDILGHLREPGPRAVGSWCLDGLHGRS
jgi:hypothetical protein